MRVLLAMLALATAVGGCSTSTYESNLAFDLTQRSYATDRKAKAVVVSYTETEPVRHCSELVVC